MDKKKLNEIRKANEKFLKRYKLEENDSIKMGFMSEDESIGKLEYIKTGNIAIDLVTGGLIKGKINVWYGSKDSGKSTSVRDALANIFNTDPNFVAGYMDEEASMDRKYWESGGVDMNRLQYLKFQTNEQALDYANACAAGTIPLDMLTIDTIQALACQGELGTELKPRSMGDDTIGLLARKYSQFLRTYTSNNNGNLTLLLISQVRTGGIGTVMVRDDMTGGNAIKHYNMITLKIEKAGMSNWPTGRENVPAASFPVKFTVDKIKSFGRYKGLSCYGYFYLGKFDKRFNTIMIGADIGLHDGKSWTYKNAAGEEVTEKYRGKNEMFDKLSPEGERTMYEALEPKFMENIKLNPRKTEEETDE